MPKVSWILRRRWLTSTASLSSFNCVLFNNMRTVQSVSTLCLVRVKIVINNFNPRFPLAASFYQVPLLISSIPGWWRVGQSIARQVRCCLSLITSNLSLFASNRQLDIKINSTPTSTLTLTSTTTQNLYTTPHKYHVYYIDHLLRLIVFDPN